MTSRTRTVPPLRRPDHRVAEPSAETLAFDAERCRSDHPTDEIPRYGEPTWDMRGLRPPHVGASRINFERLPDSWRGVVRRSFWSLLNLDAETDGEHGRALRQSGGTVLNYSSFITAFALWCGEAGVREPEAVDDLVYEDYAAALNEMGYTRHYVERRLKALTMIAVAGHRVEGAKLPVPPWATVGLDQFVAGEREGGGENRSEPVPQTVMAPLLSWALRFVNEFAVDILSAKAERDRIQALVPTTTTPGSIERTRSYFAAVRASGQQLPSYVDHAGRQVMANHYIASLVGATPHQLRRYRLREFADLELGAPAQVSTEISGRVGGRPWRGPISFGEVPQLLTLLHTAALIVVSYLTGMRPAEVLSLRRGACERFQETDGRTVYAISGRHYKHVREDGVAVPEGRVREQPWYAVAPVAKAIAVIEQLHQEDLLWPAKTPWSPTGAVRPGQTSMGPQTATFRFADFAVAATRLAVAHGRPHESVPDAGRISIGAFRRTLAWFIVWQPGGDLAAGLQYGHLEPLVTTQGYAGRSHSRGGIGDVVNMERLRRVIDSLADAADGLDRGERISGPAASRYVERVARYRETFEGRVLSERQVTELRTMPDLRIYESPTQFLTCVMDPSKALCLSGSAKANGDAPNLNRCSSRCANRARTDRHADEMRAEARTLRAIADSSALPEPQQVRYARRAELLEKEADEHDLDAEAEMHP